jgi:hypothetical protein
MKMTAPLVRMTPTGRVVLRLRALGLDIPAGAKVRRITNGRSAAARNGAWLWVFTTGDGLSLDIGSHHTLRELTTVPRLMVERNKWGEWSVSPWEPVSSRAWLRARERREEPERPAAESA